MSRIWKIIDTIYAKKHIKSKWVIVNFGTLMGGEPLSESFS